jgi:polyhydroxybutyrate depolymerase
MAVLVAAVFAACGAPVEQAGPAGSSSTTTTTAPTTSTTSAPATTTTAGPGTDGTGPTAPAAIAPVPSVGCGTPPDVTAPAEGPDVEQTITSGGTERTYRLAIPPGYDPDVPAPVIFNFHGLGSNAVEQSVYSVLPAAATKRGSIVATPDAIGGTWQLGGSEGSPPVDQVFISDLLSDLEGRFCTDARRVYAAGLSLGGLMSAVLGCGLPDTIAAIGVVTVEIKPGECEPPLPILAFHGDADPVVPYQEGGEVDAGDFSGVKVKGTLNNMVEWATLNGCAIEPDVEKIGVDVEHRVYAGCQGGAEVELYTILGGGHTWTGSAIDVPSLGVNTDTVSATELILDFFDEHPLTGPVEPLPRSG